MTSSDAAQMLDMVEHLAAVVNQERDRTMLTEQEEAQWARKVAKVRDLADEKYALICDIGFLLGGDAEIERTQERAAIFRFVFGLPRFKEAYRRIMTETL